jgi:tetratricopeptide (TPR) repeat protein
MAGDEALMRNALHAARAAGLPRTEAFVADAYNNVLGTRGRFEAGRPLTQRCIEIYEAEGMPYRQALTINFSGRCWNARAGRLEESLAYAARFRSMAADLDDARLRALRGMEAEPYLYRGLWTDVVRVAEESLPIGWEIGEGAVILFVSSWLGQALLKLGRQDDARHVVARGLGWAEGRSHTTLFAVSYVNVARALSHLADGELDQALERAQVGLDHARRSGFVVEHGAAHRVLGQVYEALRRRDEADAAFREGLQIFEGSEALPELGQTLLAYGRFRSADAPDEGRRMVERARDIFARIDAPGWLAEAGQASR